MVKVGMKKTELRSVRTESATLQVGKNGITETFITELNDRLKQNNIIKIRFLKNSPFSNRKEAFSSLESKLGSKISVLETRGWTIIVKKSN
jgi:RNA-binding protein YhbY